jgi:hypothetical protein
VLDSFLNLYETPHWLYRYTIGGGQFRKECPQLRLNKLQILDNCSLFWPSKTKIFVPWLASNLGPKYVQCSLLETQYFVFVRIVLNEGLCSSSLSLTWWRKWEVGANIWQPHCNYHFPWICSWMWPWNIVKEDPLHQELPF